MKIQTKAVTTISIALLFIFNLQGCQESSVKRDPLAPPVSDKLAPSGHIQPKVKVEDAVSGSAAIPSVVASQIPKLPPLTSINTQELYSISAVNVPVAELLFKLAKDADKEMDIYQGISGNVTINAINQPLEKILERIAGQVGFVFEVNNKTMSIKPDFPEWKNYKVDYVNIVKSSKDSIDMKMSVSAGPAGGTTTQSGSSTKVSVESEHDFWDKLEKNIQLLAQLDPNANKLILPSANGSPKNKPATASPAISSISQNTVVNPEAGVISVYTTAEKHKSIKRYIDEVSKRAEKQVLIEATVVEVVLNDDYQAGIDWSFFDYKAFGKDGGLRISSPFSGPTGGFSVATVNNLGSAAAGALSGDWNILANLKMLKQFGDSKVLSSPKIMAINNQTALLKVVNNLVYFSIDVTVTPATATAAATTTYQTEINTVPVGFTMSVTPFVSEDGDVTLNVRPTISRKVGEVADPNPDLATAGVSSVIPIIQEKEMSSVLKLKDRQTAIIGGLIEDNNSNTRTGVPWVSDVPVVGDLFSTRDDSTGKSELVIFIRPVIIKNPDVDNGDLNSVSRFLKTKQY
jgi:general secretion pathway protein D